ncbi:hypothetical protein BMS3Abin17_00068 [archaeon BMS3Abin17]|nr:hypothetical protein BMS3Abin17_00068 [archaeon BMS3Abin17]
MIDIKNTETGFGKSNLVAGFMSNLIARDFYREYEKKKYMKFNKLKGGNNIMETKSRYEVIADLEEKKRSLILQRDDLPGNLINMKKELKDLNREVEDKEESIKDYEETIKTQKETLNELIKSVDESLNRFAELNKKS